MGHKKLIRFEAIKSFPNVLQYPPGMAGKWHTFFRNDHPITLELACGKGEYTLGLGSRNPGRNYLGVDLKGNRIWAGAKKALEAGLTNVAFLRTQIEQIAQYFDHNEVDEIWITFPDPQLRISKAKKRLTHPRFLRLYQQFLRPGGYIHIKTDSPTLYRFTRRVIDLYGCQRVKDLDDVYRETDIPEALQIKTYYESLDIAGSKKVHYLCFSLPEQLAGSERDQALQEILRHEETGTD